MRHVYDRLGRDTARVNTRGKRTRYAYDQLGRLRMRWPFGDSAAVVDSFRYDLGGNLRFQWTRRGYLLEHRYDSRSRDTLTIIPTVGSYHSTYAGPLDQLTRAWITGFGDSIGGVNPDVRWIYSQAGLLLADTAQGTRVTTRLYDRLGRDTLVTDPAGAWRSRYDAVRGMLDSLITPYGDTLRWTYDQRWRAVGPTVLNGASPDYAITPAWDQVGKLIDLQTMHTVQVGRWQVDTTMPDLELRPVWSEQQGSGGPTVTALDTLVHDGWGRVTGAYYLKNGAALASETFSFDRTGSLRKTGESRTYDATTARLTARAGGTYSYDRSGNLVSWVSGGTTWTYGFDALERLIWVRQNGALIARYGYDVLGRRIVKRVYSGANAGYLRMIYAGGQVVADADSAGALTYGYTWGFGADNLVAMHRYSDNSDYYVVRDPLGSVRGLTRRDGTWLASWRYRIYGAVLDSAGAAPFALRYRWTGREFDQETGFYFFRSRSYDPASQRFVQEDPIGYAGGANLYAYGAGNPTNGRDPDGLKMSNLIDGPIDPDFFTNCWSIDCSGAGGGGSGDWDGDGTDDFMAAFDEQFDRQHQFAHSVTVCVGANCRSTTVYAPALTGSGQIADRGIQQMKLEVLGEVSVGPVEVVPDYQAPDRPGVDPGDWAVIRLFPPALDRCPPGLNKVTAYGGGGPYGSTVSHPVTAVLYLTRQSVDPSGEQALYTGTIHVTFRFSDYSRLRTYDATGNATCFGGGGRFTGHARGP